MLYLALTINQAYAQSWLNDADSVPEWYLNEWEWNELGALMPLQFENGNVYAAAPAPRFEPLDCELTATQAGDWIIDERMDKLEIYRGE